MQLKRFLFILIVSAIAVGLLYLALVARANEIHYIEVNGECQINDSEHICTPGTVCVLFNDESDNGKCTTLTPTPTPVITGEPSVTPEPTQTPCSDDCPTITPTPDITIVPTEPPGNQPLAPGAPPEWSNKCFYLKDNPDCKTQQQVFPGEDNQAGVHK